MFCGNCGKKIDQDSIYCEFCGTQISNKREDNNENKKVQTTKQNGHTSGLQKTALIMGILGFFIYICAPLAIVFGSMTIKEKPNINAKWGLWLGITATALVLIGILTAMVLVALDSARQKAIEATQNNSTHQIY